MHLGLIGYGAIGQALLARLAADASPPERVTVLVRPGRTIEDLPLPGAAVQDAGALAAARPDLVVEAAGHGAVPLLVPLLSGGMSCLVASVGALADPGMETRLRGAPDRGAQLLIPAGAIGGIDMAAALAKAGLSEVSYVGRKPPMAWAGTPAEARCDLAGLTGPVTIFEGSARQAAREFPKNANVAATLALATLGFDETRVRLVADPAATGNIHAFTATGPAATMRFEVTATPTAANPRSSETVVLSLLRAVRNRTAALVI